MKPCPGIAEWPNPHQGKRQMVGVRAEASSGKKTRKFIFFTTGSDPACMLECGGHILMEQVGLVKRG
jgi:hypothetical protein